MLNSTRLPILMASGLLALVLACSGSSDTDAPSNGGTPSGSATAATANDRDGSREDDVRRDVMNALNAILGDELDAAEFAKYSPNECPQDVAELTLGFALVQAFLGDAEIEFEITEIDFPDDDRALVTVSGSADFLESFGATSSGGEAEADLWVLQDDRWRNTSDCEAFDDERAALGLNTTTDAYEDFTDGFGDGFGEDFGPPVAASPGQALPVGDLVVTINGASLSSESNAFGDPPEGVFVVVDFTFANDGQEPTSPWWALDLKLFDDRDRTWDSTDIPSEDVGPGFAKEFRVSWDVPLDATGFRLVVSADPFVDLPLPDDFAPWEVALGTVE